MSSSLECPNQELAEKKISHLSDVLEVVRPAIGLMLDNAADANRLATEDPLSTIDRSLSPQDITDDTLDYASNFSRLDSAVTNASEIVSASCPGSEACAQACLKRTVITDAFKVLEEWNEVTRPV